MSVFSLLLMIATARVALGFLPTAEDSISHTEITERAILRKTMAVLRELAASTGRVFDIDSISDIDNPTSEEIFRAYYGREVSPIKFEQAMQTIEEANVDVDHYHPLSAKHHFDSESFVEAKSYLRRKSSGAKENIMKGNYESGRRRLGEMLHTLQDFYSHSNWIELGYTVPNPDLIGTGEGIGNTAALNQPTCSDCNTETCEGNILNNILQSKLITTGYFSQLPIKPAGKCSHGGPWDMTRKSNAKGGINKDHYTSEHRYLHKQAADVAVSATEEVLEDIRNAVGDKAFIKFLNIESPASLCFVIDTTGSMGGEIENAKQRAFSIIDSKRGTPDEPSTYVLVPFNDPDFGPVYKTSDANIFKASISLLTANGGGDTPEMCLSGIQLALINSPPSSEIYVFTDAPAKDGYLRNNILALMESTKSSVTFLLTNVLYRKKRSGQQGQQGRAMGIDTLYQDLAATSGGQTIETTKASLQQITAVISDSSTSALVTLFQAKSTRLNVGSTYYFHIDKSVTNITAYISGSILSYTLSNPRGVEQDSSLRDGPLGTMENLGRFYILRLSGDVGQWQINISSYQDYSLKVTGQSIVSFLYSFVEPFEGPHPGLGPIEGRPQTGQNVTMVLRVTGLTVYKTFAVKNVSFAAPDGSLIGGSPAMPALSSGLYYVYVERFLGQEFALVVTGQDNGSSEFRRQSNTRITSSRISVQVEANSTFEPGKQYTIPFTVATSGTGGTYSVRVRDDKGFVLSAASSIYLEENRTKQGEMTFQSPNGTESGTSVTVTIEVESPDLTDMNYALLQLTIAREVVDFDPPICTLVFINENCSTNCAGETWALCAQVRDSGVGVQRIYTRLGNGTLNTSVVWEGGVNTTLVNYTASCCSNEVSIIAVDNAGNVGKYHYSARGIPGATPYPDTFGKGQPGAVVGSALLCSSLLALLALYTF
ncbi:von Willebrand factor A domain-containing protein 7-like [Polyodon spathula]|uniref:von Willebrand factor A domain-containing protein 7-like n=1 Tax=Polyodon spathula TaxID=7913 RepID=UPI001B7F144F|nr:von Willebrand factor A domain-containing protein 7-like [Polyodon spathula]